jgi:hypothetical protein
LPFIGPNGLCRSPRLLHEYDATLAAETKLYVRMRELNFGMCAQGSSVEFVAGAAAEVGRWNTTGAQRALSLA